MKKKWKRLERWLYSRFCKKQRITILMRRDREYNWQKANPVLRHNEIAASMLNSGRAGYKIGDGVTPYNELPFLSNELIRQVDVYNPDKRVPIDKITVYFKKWSLL